MPARSQSGPLKRKEDNGEDNQLYDAADDDESDNNNGRRLQDKGWAWMTMLGCFLAHLITGGLERSDGVFFLKLTARYGESAQVTAWAGALAATVMLTMGPVASAISSRYSERTSVMCGSFLYSAGLICSGLAPNMASLIICFGFVQGIGRGLTYAPGLVIVGTYFKRRRGLAIGVATAGVGVGTFLLPPLVQVLFEEFGFSGAFLILGGIALNFCLVAMLYRPFFLHATIVLRHQKTKDVERNKEKNPKCRCRVGWRRRKPGTAGGDDDDGDSNGGGGGGSGDGGGKSYPLLLRSCTVAGDSGAVPQKEPRCPCQTDTGQGRATGEDREALMVSCGPEASVWPASGCSAAKNTNTATAAADTAAAAGWNTQANGDPVDETGSPPIQTQQTDSGSGCARQSFLNGRTAIDDLEHEAGSPPVQTQQTDSGCGNIQQNHLNSRKSDLTRGDSMSSRTLKMDTNSSGFAAARPARFIASWFKTCFPSNPRRAEVGRSASSTKRKLFDWALVREPAFLFYCFSICLFTVSLKSSLAFLPPLVRSCGVSEIHAAYLLSISGVLDTIGRISTGWILELKRIRRFRPAVFTGFIFAICVVLFFAPFMSTFAEFGAVFALFGLLTGAYVSQKSVVLMDMLGVDRLASSFGLLCFFQGVGNLVGPPLSGVLKDTLGHYREVFFLGGGSLAVAGVLMIASNIYGARTTLMSQNH